MEEDTIECYDEVVKLIDKQAKQVFQNEHFETYL